MKNKRSDKVYEELCEDFSLLGRDTFYKSLFQELTTFNESLHVALCGPWGSGKTVFIKHLKQQIASDKNTCLYINAWDYDYFETPLYAVLNSLLENDDFRNLFNSRVANVKLSDISLTANIPFFSMSARILNERSEILSKLEFSSLALKVIYETILEFMNERAERLVIFIDEIDRCRPDFSVTLLEQLKHLRFEKPVFLMYIIDETQLSLAMKKVYGDKYDTSQYLHKLFDNMIIFPQASEEGLKQYIRIFSPEGNENWVQFFMIEAQKSYNLTFRDINRLVKYIPRIDRELSSSHFDIPIDNWILVGIMFMIVVIKIKDPIFINSVFNNEVDIQELVLFLKKSDYMNQVLLDNKKYKPESTDNLRDILLWLFGRTGKYKENVVKKVIYSDL